MIKKIKCKFIILSMSALLVLLAVIVTGMNVVNYNTIVSDADETLNLLSLNKGTFPKLNKNDLPKHMTEETPYESRYFSVLLDLDNQVIQSDTSRIKAIDADEAIEYAASVIAKEDRQGFIDNYRFLYYKEGKSTRIIFLDCEKRIASFYNFLFTSILMTTIGYFVFFFVILFFSGKILRPIAESYEKQKQFITDAGHELKTPLAIVQADVDVLEIDFGENEWLEDIQKQTKRLTTLTNDLVYLSRMEEVGNSMEMIEFPLSDVAYEVINSFLLLAQTQNKICLCNIQPMISFMGNEPAIRQLINILMDNALKYSPAYGTVSVSLQKQGRQIRFTVFNTTTALVQKDRLNMIFERFYRMDFSRNSQTGGHGIGLSIAKAIVNSHGGKISAATADGNSLEITVQFPV